jgi:drug/metabolite transporter (DMT)-like permease
MTKPLSVTRRLAALLSLTAAMVLTGAIVALGKAIVAEVPIYIFMLFPVLLSTAALSALVHWHAGPKLTQMRAGQVRDLLAMAVPGMIGFTALMFEGLKATSAGDAGIIAATLPAVVALLGVVVMRDRLTMPQVGAVGLAVAGLVLVEATGALGDTAPLLGNLLVLGAVLCEASVVLLGKRLAPPCFGWRWAAIWSGWASPLRWRCSRSRLIAAVCPSIWLLGIWYALSASVFCLWLWYRGLPDVETWLAGLSTAELPVTALGASALFLAETIEAWKLLGGALVLGATVLGAVTQPR